jgi:hypothetical protein
LSGTPIGFVGVQYSQAGTPVFASYTGGTGPLTWAIISGSLPAGITGVTENGNNTGHYYYLTGAPTTIGTSTFTIRGTDTLGVTDTVSGTIVVETVTTGGGGPDPGGGGILPGDTGDHDSIFGDTDLR